MFAKLKSLLNAKEEGAAKEGQRLKAQGDACLRQDQLDQAADWYGRALAADATLVDARIALGHVLTEQGQPAQARAHLEQALLAQPGNTDAHYVLARVARQQGDAGAAITHLEHAVAGDPAHAFAQRDLLGLLAQGSDSGRAVAAARRAAAVFPQSAEFQYYLATALDAANDTHAAIACYRQALALQPDAAAAHSGLGVALLKLGSLAEAAACLRQATLLAPEDAAAHQHLGNTWLKLGDTAAALASFRDVLKLQPDNPVGHLVAALSGQTPDHPPSDYVAQLFDTYAEGFDAHLVQRLRYAVPGKLAALLLPYAQGGQPQWRVLDLGCGTGLAGRAMAPLAQELVGVDLSAGMLARARALGLYQRLEQADLSVALLAEADAAFDAVVAADVLIYVGRLDDLVPQVGRVLRPGGLFAFSVEALPVPAAADGAVQQQGYQLRASARYAHGLAYLEKLAAGSGFEVLQTVAEPIRLDRGQPIPGHLLLWRRR